MKIFSGNSSILLTENICKNLIDKKPGKIFVQPFDGGESYCQFQENLRGEDIFLVQSLNSSPLKSCNDYFLELLTMIQAAKRASAKRVTAVIPYFPCRQDRKTESRTPITAKLWADLIEAAGADRVLTMHMHNSSVEGFFNNIIVDSLQSESVFLNDISPNSSEDYVVVSPDLGGVKHAKSISDYLKCDMAISIKDRLTPNKIQLNSFVGYVENKTALIFDDLTETFNTIELAAEACKNNGAKKVLVFITHLLNKEIFKRTKSNADKVMYSDTCEIGIQSFGPIFYQKSVSHIFAKAIECIHHNKSVSSLFTIKSY